MADIVGEDGIIEIQTRNFIKLKPKLAELLKAVHVTVVYPLISEKHITNAEYSTGEVISSRKSPKHDNIYSSVHELYAIKSMLGDDHLTIRMPILSVDEIRVYGATTRRRKKQRTRKGEYISDIIPTDLLDEIILDSTDDYRIFIPESLPETFGSAEFAKIANTDIYSARRILNILHSMKLIEKKGKIGRSIMYRINNGKKN